MRAVGVWKKKKNIRGENDMLIGGGPGYHDKGGGRQGRWPPL